MPFINITKENHPKLSQSAWDEFFLGTQERVRNSRGKRSISVRAIEVLLYAVFVFSMFRLNRLFPIVNMEYVKTCYIALFVTLTISLNCHLLMRWQLSHMVKTHLMFSENLVSL